MALYRKFVVPVITTHGSETTQPSIPQDPTYFSLSPQQRIGIYAYDSDQSLTRCIFCSDPMHLCREGRLLFLWRSRPETYQHLVMLSGSTLRGARRSRDNDPH